MLSLTTVSSLFFELYISWADSLLFTQVIGSFFIIYVFILGSHHSQRSKKLLPLGVSHFSDSNTGQEYDSLHSTCSFWWDAQFAPTDIGPQPATDYILWNIWTFSEHSYDKCHKQHNKTCTSWLWKQFGKWKYCWMQRRRWVDSHVDVFEFKINSLPHYSLGWLQPGRSMDPSVSSIFHEHPQFPCALPFCIFPQGVQQSVLLSPYSSMSMCWFPDRLCQPVVLGVHAVSYYIQSSLSISMCDGRSS